jgi:histidyl-tRNA synthetase
MLSSKSFVDSMRHAHPKGTFDILPVSLTPSTRWQESQFWDYVEAVVTHVSSLYGLQRIRTPVFEEGALFASSVGEETDIVSKEMYTFHDRANRLLALRPEGTAPTVRAIIEHGLQHHPECKRLFYIAPMFRYERQQAGRFRQHHQWGAELFGLSDPDVDGELIVMIHDIGTRLGLGGLRIALNSVGDVASRTHYKEHLRTYLAPFVPSLSQDSQRRFTTNLLRILDSKDSGDQEILAHAPSLLNFLNPSRKSI